MMKQYSKLLLCLLSILFLFGCLQNNATENNTKQKGLADKQTEDIKSGKEIAEHLTNLVTRVPEVNDATTVVIGDLAVIGVDVNAELDRSEVGTVKYSVAEAIQSDPYGAHAFVTADVDTISRLKEMRKEIEAGHPVAGIMDELAAIVGRLMPVTPGEEHKKSAPKPTNENDEKINNKQKNDLENIQEKQGKRDMDKENIPERKKNIEDIPDQGDTKDLENINEKRDKNINRN